MAPVLRCPRAWLLVAAAALAIASVATDVSAQQQLATCVTVRAGASLRDDLRRLVESELDRHPNHHATRKDCQSHLRVELLDLGKDGRWLTGRINTQVPHRVAVRDAGLDAAVRELLTVLLHNDPLVLRGPRSRGWFDAKLEELRKRSLMYGGVELFQQGLILRGEHQSLPGVALIGRREIDSLHVGLRIAGAWDPARHERGLRLKTVLEASVDLMLYSDPLGNSSWFAGTMLGLTHQRFEGPSPYRPPEFRSRASDTGAALGLRGGIELFRATDVRLSFFGQLMLPAFAAHDQDDGVVDDWVPVASFGVGLLL